MRHGSRTLAMLAAGVVLLMAATLAADVVLSNSAISVVGPPTSWTGEVVRSEMTGAYPVAAAIHGYAPVTGYAVYGEAVGGVGVYGVSSTNPGVLGSSGSGDGGRFTSTGGYGVYAYTTGTSHWDHGVYALANWGYGVYAKSVNNDGVRGEGKSTGVRGSGASQGIAGSSTNGTGVYGSSSSGYGIYGWSNNSYGGYFYSSTYRGLYAASGALWYDAYFGGTQGIYVAGDIYAGGSKAGYVVDLARNDGPGPLQLGDVVVITGATDPLLGEIPVPTVRLADEAASPGVMGVVDRMFATPADVEAIPEELAEAWLKLANSSSADARSAMESPGRFVRQAEAEFLAAAKGLDPGIAPGAYLGVVTLGAFKAVRVDAANGSILPGDLLVSSPTPGHAMRALDPEPGTIIGKALGSLVEGQGTVPVLITAH